MNERFMAATADFSIGDVSRMCDIPAHTIRYWEREFKSYLAPPRTRGYQRRYADHDIKKLIRIKKLLWDDGFTIAGARRLLGGKSIFTLVNNATTGDEPVTLQAAG
ncbi:MAG: MerR family transcriptional regulator [Chitinivibrionales bacterium]|nr:MerR family transcriptional regulator [Chitinivibrionales bacterium]